MEATTLRAEEFDKREERLGEEELNKLQSTGRQHEDEWERQMHSDLARHEMTERNQLSEIQRKTQQRLDIFENAMLPEEDKPGGQNYQRDHFFREQDIEDKQDDIK